MNILTFTDAHQRTIEVDVHRGDEIFITQRYPWLGPGWDGNISFVPLTMLEDILGFCQDAMQRSRTKSGTPIIEHGITLKHNDMTIMACIELEEQGMVSMRNTFRDVDDKTHRSVLKRNALPALAQAVAFGQKCREEWSAMSRTVPTREEL
jgi:hypothetical protein